jgi:hypothetical protein
MELTLILITKFNISLLCLWQTEMKNFTIDLLILICEEKKCSSDLAKSHIKFKKVEPRDKKQRVVPRAKSQGGKRQTVALRATSGR